MTLTDLFPPIAAATVVSAFLFAGMWRASQIERARGAAPWYLVVGGLAYLGALSLFWYLRNGDPLRSGFDVFGAAMIGECGGVFITFAILHAALFSRGQKRSDRGFAVVVAGTFSCVLIWSLFR